MSPGKFLRFPEIFLKEYPLIISPIDDLLLSGPINGLENPEMKIKSILAAKPTALLTFYGTIKKYYKELVDQKTIINLSASTIRSNYTKKVLIGTIESALRINASAIAIHINVCSQYASQMISDAANIIEQADRFEIPTVGILYPRGENAEGITNEYEELKFNDPEAYSEIVAHCVQIGVDLGVDLIKTQYSGTPESFKKVIVTAQKTPVVVAGGVLIDETKSISNAVDAYLTGAAGISFARNVFGRNDPEQYLIKIRKALTEIKNLNDVSNIIPHK